MLECFVDNFQLLFAEITTTLAQPFPYQTHTHLMTQWRYFDKTAGFLTADNLAIMFSILKYMHQVFIHQKY